MNFGTFAKKNAKNTFFKQQMTSESQKLIQFSKTHHHMNDHFNV